MLALEGAERAEGAAGRRVVDLDVEALQIVDVDELDLPVLASHVHRRPPCRRSGGSEPVGEPPVRHLDDAHLDRVADGEVVARRHQ